MATQHRQQPSRLFIPPMLNSQLANSVDARTMFSPALQTANQANFPPFPPNSAFPPTSAFPLQTPMQPSFFPHPPNAPSRPPHMGHRQHGSMAGFGPLGMHPVPMTPLGQQFPPTMLHGGPSGIQPHAQPFIPKSRRTPSMIGGPPKAALGGPGRKVSPMPAMAAVVQGKLKGKKVVVKLPIEVAEAEEGEEKGAVTKPLWTRTPIATSSLPEQPEISLPETNSADVYPLEEHKKHLPPTVDVFLPGKAAWDEMRQRIIEEKLEKLGIEKRPEFAPGVPEIHAPHARAASISSPADPALLFFKLNKLQQQQQSAGSSLATSPQPPSASISPDSRFPNRMQAHGHSMSLAQPPTFQPHSFTGPGGYDVLGNGGNVGPDGDGVVQSSNDLFAPQGRKPARLSVPPSSSRPESRPDFLRGFGLDIPEEEEEEEEEEKENVPPVPTDQSFAPQAEISQPEDKLPSSEVEQEIPMEEPEMSMAQTAVSEHSHHASTAGVHMRHASRISVTLSVGSAPRYDETVVEHSRKASRASIEMGQFVKSLEEEEVAGEFSNDPLNEWTGSEDLVREGDDQESIGEWSNPSDEERARHERLQRRYMHRVQEDTEEAPRRIPEFPRPPENQRYVAMRGDDEDIISNPSEEEMPARRYTMDELQVDVHYDQYYPQTSISMPLSQENVVGRASRPLPPLPDSREGSTYYSHHGSLPSHSRGASEHLANGGAFAHVSSSLPISRPDSNASGHGKTASITSTSKGNLNPFAKPFVFGGRPSFVAATAPVAPSPSLPASVPSEAASSPAQGNVPTHSRLPSLGTGRALNVAAPEFKPGNFTFRAPGGVPALSFPEPTHLQPIEPPRPLPIPPTASSSRAMQGREKRQRLSESPEASDVEAESEYEDEDVDEEEEEEEEEDREGRDTMSSFKFPSAPEPTMVFHRSAPTSPTPSNLRSGLNASAKAFTFNGPSPVLPPLLGQETRSLAEAIQSTVQTGETTTHSVDATRGSALDNLSSPELTLPNTHKQKRAPIPLDFKHPVSTNMVPAGLFKNLANADAEEKPRLSARHGSSFELSNRSDVSLDDLSVPAISHKISRARLVPEQQDKSQDDFEDASQASEASSMRSHLSSIDTPISPESPESIIPPDMAGFNQALRLEERLEALFDKKFKTLQEGVLAQSSGEGRYISSTTDEMVREAMAMFRTQLRDSTEKALEDSTMDARGGFDFEMIKSIIEDTHEKAHGLLFQKLVAMLGDMKEIEHVHRGASSPAVVELVHSMENLRMDLLSSNSHLHDTLAHFESGSLLQAWHKDAFVSDMIAALVPHLNAVRSEPIDYDGLTIQLSQAVKPHISQLIDLASDKRETAELIANRLMPILQSFATAQPEIDTESLVADVTAAVNRVIEPIDTHVMKEQVADLVVERLDARLAVRDKMLNFDSLKTNVAESIGSLADRFDALGESLESLKIGQADVATGTKDAVSAQAENAKSLVELGEKLGSLVDALGTVKSSVDQQQQSTDTAAQQLERIVTGIELLKTAGEALAEEKNEIISISKRLVDDLSPIPEAVTASFDKKYSELLEHIEKIQDNSREVRKLATANADLQGKLAKAQGAHGLIRVEKDNLKSRLTETENERDHLRAKVEEFEAAAKTQADELAALEARTADQEQAMHTALDRLKVSDVNAQSQQERIAELEKANRESGLEKQQLKSKIDHLNMQVEFAVKDKESAQQALRLLQADRDNLVAQQSHWEDLRRASEQIEALAMRVAKIDSDEVAELKQARDRSKVLEGEHAALQKRFREQESKLANVERASMTVRQNFAQAQQRAAEWEKRAREAEGEVERLTTAVEQGEQTRAQLEADVQMVKMQMEEKDAQERLRQDHERKLEEDIATLKTKLSDLTSQLEEERKIPRKASNQWVVVDQKHDGSQRPSSRSSMTHEASEPPTPKVNGRVLSAASSADSFADARVMTSPEPVSSIWDSRHAPKGLRSLNHASHTTPSTPTLRTSRAPSYVQRRVASPTPSVVSVAPTQGDDGWWS